MSEKVVIFPYDPKWQEEFSLLGVALRSALGNTAIRIDQVIRTRKPLLFGVSSKKLLNGAKIQDGNPVHRMLRI